VNPTRAILAEAKHLISVERFRRREHNREPQRGYSDI